MKWYSEKIIKEAEKNQLKYNIGAGHIVVNQMVALTHVISGLLRNSIVFRLPSGKRSKFASEGTGKPTENDAVGKADDKEFIRVGSAVLYAGAYEKHTGTFSQAVDTVIRNKSLIRLAEKVFK